MKQDNIPELKIERLDSETGDGLILLTQDSGGNEDSVAIHPIHLRHMAEMFGLVPASDPDALRTIATLKRRLLVLRERAGHLAYWLAHDSDTAHADLSEEQTYATATAEIADEFCADLMDARTSAPFIQAECRPAPEVASKQQPIDF